MENEKKSCWYVSECCKTLLFLSWAQETSYYMVMLNDYKGLQGVTRMAYSPSLWLMANWLVKQNQPVSKIETKSDTNLRSLYES
jgi:hypothetical protein